jgi:hypothetical protein
MACNQRFSVLPSGSIPGIMPFSDVDANEGNDFEDLNDLLEVPCQTDSDVALIDSTADYDPKGK